MDTIPNNMSVADYCSAIERKDITVNRTYQRSEQVWPESARSFLVETIILGFPVPTIYLHSKVDLKSKQTYKELVDGRQRTKVIIDYFNNKFRLTRTLDNPGLHGCYYDDLDDDYQTAFITYSLSFDEFVGATDEEVIEIFRRMNSYTVPLNPEESRHAIFQGEFKWFIYRKANEHERVFLEFKVFGPRALVRMQDLKLLTEICYAMDNGVSTTNAKTLRNLYKTYDREFGREKEFSERLDYAFGVIDNMGELKDSNISRPHVFYSLVLAVIACRFGIPGIDGEGICLVPDSGEVQELEVALLAMSAALEMEGELLAASGHAEFVSASSERTNVKEQRLKRIECFMDVVRETVG